MKVTAKQIFARVSMLNPSVSEISSMGQFVSHSSQMVADSVREDIYRALPEQSLAYKILNSTDKFSDKQLWVIAFELEKNEAYTTTLASSLNEIKRKEALKKASKKAKKQNLVASLAPSNKKTSPTVSENATYGVDTKVAHDKFGEGVVVEEDQDRITIQFDEAGKKNLLKKFVKLEIL